MDTLTTLDWAIVVAFFVLSLGVGLLAAKRAGRNSSEFFLSGRDMPWWLLGVSMVATTFAIDTPNLVADLVRKNGVAGNWGWWAFLLSGMLTVFVFAKLWRRAGVMTDVEFYELRYGGRSAAFLRGFRALYLGLIFNVLVMGAVSLAAVKFGEIVLGIEAWKLLLGAGVTVLIYSSLGGLRGIILTDFVQFGLAMVGSVWAAIYLMGHEKVGGLSKLLSHESVQGKMEMMPVMSDATQWVPILLVPLAVIWWSSYYPGSEPGGGGYIAQRMFSAKNERHAMGATLFFNIAHYALRPWPWILIALASLVVFPDLDSIREAFPKANPDLIGDDAAYPAMLTLLPPGLLGLVAASLIAAYMSTMSTQVNLGASYLVNDFYRRFLKPDASEVELVWAGRVATAVTLALGCVVGLFLRDALQAFKYLLLLGAGTGLIYILRWFWWRVSALAEIVAMMVSLVVATFFTFFYPEMKPEGLNASGNMWWDLGSTVLPVVLTTAAWILVCYLAPSRDEEKLREFCRKVRPGGPGWSKVYAQAETDGAPITGSDRAWGVPFALGCAVLGCLTVYAAIFGVGSLIYGRTMAAFIYLGSCFILGGILVVLWKRIPTDSAEQ